MSRQDGRSAMEDMLASIREAIHEEAAHQAVGLHAPLHVRAGHEAPVMHPDNDRPQEVEPPEELLRETPAATVHEQEEAAGLTEATPEEERPAAIGETPFAPRRRPSGRKMPSVGGIMSGRTPLPATDPETPATAEGAPESISTETGEAEFAGDAMFDAVLEDDSWWPENDAHPAAGPEQASASMVREDAAVSPSPHETGDAEPLVSPRTGELAARAFDMLRQELELPEDLRAMTEEMLRPMLREWLDANLPEMVERLVREEISRIAHGAPPRRMR